jgi:hypothetical protein
MLSRIYEQLNLGSPIPVSGISMLPISSWRAGALLTEEAKKLDDEVGEILNKKPAYYNFCQATLHLFYSDTEEIKKGSKYHTNYLIVVKIQDKLENLIYEKYHKELLIAAL